MTSLERNKILWIGMIGIVCGMLLVFSLSRLAHAQPSSVTTQTIATATTTVSYMSAGTATTTYQFDAQTFSSGKISDMATIDSGTMYVQFTASTSASNLVWQFQCSNNNIDWYSDEVGSSTLGSAVASTTRVITPISACVTHHERVLFSIAPTVTGGAVYAEFDLKKNPSNP